MLGVLSRARSREPPQSPSQSPSRAPHYSPPLPQSASILIRNDEPPFPATRATVYRPTSPPATAPPNVTSFKLSPSAANPRRISIRFAPLPEAHRQRAYSTGRNVWLHPEDGELEGGAVDEEVVLDDVSDRPDLRRVTSNDSTSSRSKLSRKIFAPLQRIGSSGSGKDDQPGWALAGAPLDRSVSADTGLSVRQRPAFPNAYGNGLRAAVTATTGFNGTEFREWTSSTSDAYDDDDGSGMAWIRKRRAERLRLAEADAAAAAAAASTPSDTAEDPAPARLGVPLVRSQTSPELDGSPATTTLSVSPLDSITTIATSVDDPADESAVAEDDDADADEGDGLTSEERAEEERLTREAKVSTISRSAAAERFHSSSATPRGDVLTPIGDSSPPATVKPRYGSSAV